LVSVRSGRLVLCDRWKELLEERRRLCMINYAKVRKEAQATCMRTEMAVGLPRLDAKWNDAPK
jgi:hypothetical protein